MFFLKKLLSRFLFPVPLCAELLVLGLLLWSFTKWKKLGRGLVVAGTLLLLAFSYLGLVWERVRGDGGR